jgi:hypothetical protein
MTASILHRVFLLFLLGVLLIVGCKKEKSYDYSVPQELLQFINAFENEAAIRGKKIQINNLILEYDPNLRDGVCGLSNIISSTDNIQKLIKLRSNAGCWNCEAELEALIFHELGHCVLGRFHDNRKLPKGYARSLMTSNDLQLYSNCFTYPIGDYYSRRSYYLDELFDSTTIVPEWGR